MQCACDYSRGGYPQLGDLKGDYLASYGRCSQMPDPIPIWGRGLVTAYCGRWKRVEQVVHTFDSGVLLNIVSNATSLQERLHVFTSRYTRRRESRKRSAVMNLPMFRSDGASHPPSKRPLVRYFHAQHARRPNTASKSCSQTNSVHYPLLISLLASETLDCMVLYVPRKAPCAAHATGASQPMVPTAAVAREVQP